MTISDEILVLANQIANSGHKPSVALIKTKLNKKVPLPEIIANLKVWQHDPNFISLPKDNEAEQTSLENQVISRSFEQTLNEELTTMKNEIRELKQLVTKLIEQQKS